jgi:ElaB/YqjD/DUF883 family membrane-anchored ribosome-binding protein
MRQEIDCTRAALADKVEALEDKVMGTVHSAQDTVEDSIQMARDTVATVQRTFDIKHHVEQHPWIMLGGCVLAGVAAGSLFAKVRRSRTAGEPGAGNEKLTTQLVSPRTQARVAREVGIPSTAEEFGHDGSVNRRGFLDLFHEEIAEVKGMAIGYVMGLVRDSIKESVPQLASQIDRVMNGVTTKLGGEPDQARTS